MAKQCTIDLNVAGWKRSHMVGTRPQYLWEYQDNVQPYDLYYEAIAWADHCTRFDQGEKGSRRDFLIARHAARQTATALLEKAKELGLSQDQWEALRKVAAQCATD